MPQASNPWILLEKTSLKGGCSVQLCHARPGKAGQEPTVNTSSAVTRCMPSQQAGQDLGCGQHAPLFLGSEFTLGPRPPFIAQNTVRHWTKPKGTETTGGQGKTEKPDPGTAACGQAGQQRSATQP